MARRFAFPFELEWMEGGSLIQVLRLLEGKPLYVEPSLSYIPYVYPPLYYYVSALVAWTTGSHWFSTLRLVSIVSTVATGFLIYRIVQVMTGTQYWGFVAAGLFAAGFSISGFWFDIARTDMLFIFLFMAGTYLLLRPGRFSALSAGVLFALAFYTKQSMLMMFLLIEAFLLIRRSWRTAGQLGLGFAGPSLILFFVENWASHGWYRYYLFDLPGLHRLIEPAWLAALFIAVSLGTSLAVAVVLGFLPLAAAPRETLGGNRGLLAVITLSALAISVATKIAVGGYSNDYLPALATVPILTGIGAAWLIANQEPAKRAMVSSVVCLLLLLQFALLYYDVPSNVPTKEDRQAGESLVASLASTPGQVLIPYHSYLAVLAGKEPSAHQETLWELSGVLGHGDPAKWRNLDAEIDRALVSRTYSRIFLDGPDAVWEAVPTYYRESGWRFPVTASFNPRNEDPPPALLEFLPK